MFSLTIDTADGQTTSPQPSPFTLPRTLDQMSSPNSPSVSPPCTQSQNQTLDRSQSAPATMEQASAPGQCQDQPGFQGLPLPERNAGSTLYELHPPLLPDHSPSTSPLPSQSTEVPSKFVPPANVTADMAASGSQALQFPEGDTLSKATEEDAESFEVLSSSQLPHPEELSPIQPMEQEVSESDTTDAEATGPNGNRHSDTVEMESPTASQDVVSSERDQPEGERCSSSDSIPSLAAALMELHELLVSNNHPQSQNRSTSCSPSHPFRQDNDESAPEPCNPAPEVTQPTLSTAITASAEPSDAKANHAAAASEGPSKCIVPDLSGQDEHLDRDSSETVEGQGPLQCPDSSRERRGSRCGQDEASNICISQPAAEVPPDPVGDLEFREPPEGQQGRGVADGRASGTNTPDTLGLQTEHTFLSPLSMAVGSPEEVSSTSFPSVPPLAHAARPTSPAPHLPALPPFTEQFPAEHIQRIQAAGFSASEAAEALEQAHGVVELALLALLARSITVPT